MIPAFANWLSEKLGTDKWVVSGRLTSRLLGKGYTVAVSQKKFSALAREFEATFGRDAW